MTQKSQYASSVINVSSEYGIDEYSAKQALNAPNTDYGDNPTAWAAESADGTIETLTLGFATPVYANGVSIYESNGNGFVSKIEVLSVDNNYSPVWAETDTSVSGTQADFSVSFMQTAFLVKGIRITVNTNHSDGVWEQIDAVQLRGDTAIEPTPTNQPPTDLTLISIDENVPVNTVVGTFRSIDADANNTFTYSLVTGAGSADNDVFSIVGNKLKITRSPDFEKQDTYSIRVRTTDQDDASFDKILVIAVNNLDDTATDNTNVAPTNISLSKTDLDENSAVNSLVGILSSTDPNIDDSFNYSLVSGAGSSDNSAFSIAGNQLKINASPNFETKDSYNIRVRTTDQGNLSFDKAITITINNLDDPIGQAIYGDLSGSTADKLDGTDAAEKMYGKDLKDTLHGGLNDDTLYGGNGDDELFGQGDNDALFGEQDDDYLSGGTGNDMLTGGDGVDTMIGGDGSDTYYLGYDAPDSIDDAGLASDVDTVIMPYQIKSYRLDSGIENAEITASTEAGNLIGSSIANTLTGNEGKNIVKGNGGNDTLIGGGGNDGLQGDNAADSLTGNAGNDVLNGGAGNDTLVGGAGRDVFKFANAMTANIDHISDFDVTADIIQLENGIFTTLTTTGILASNAFTIGDSATTSTEKIIYNSTTGAIYYDADGNANHAAVQIAIVGVNLALTPADFVVT